MVLVLMKYLDVPKSGSLQSDTYSRNRYGQYIRSRSNPVNPGTAFQTAVRSRLATYAGNWRGLSVTQREGWGALGAQMTRTDSLGQTYDLTGFQAYVSVCANLVAAGDAAVTDAPALEQPDAILTLTPTLTSASFSVAFTPTPLGAGERLLVFAGPQRSSGRGYEGDYRLVHVSAAAGTSPANVLSGYQGRFGSPTTGNRIFISCQRYHNGFLSAALTTSAVVA